MIKWWKKMLQSLSLTTPVSAEEQAARARGRLVEDFVDRVYKHTYKFEFVWHGHYWVIWCRACPRCPFAVPPTQYHLLRGNQVCVTRGREPRTLSRAKAVAYLWMRGYSVYVKTGSFPNRAETINVPD